MACQAEFQEYGERGLYRLSQEQAHSVGTVAVCPYCIWEQPVLQKDFGNTAYATIRRFVLKFKQLELL